MNVLHLIETSGPGGAEKVLINLVEYMSEQGHRSMVCLMREGWLSRSLKDSGIPVVVLPQRGAFDGQWIRSLVRMIRTHDISVMHAHEFAMNTYGSVAAAIARVPIITTVHGKNYYPNKRPYHSGHHFILDVF